MTNMLTSLGEYEWAVPEGVETPSGPSRARPTVDLGATVRTAVIPRLRAALLGASGHAGDHASLSPLTQFAPGRMPREGAAPVARERRTPGHEDVDGLVTELLVDDRCGARRRIETLLGQGVPLESILVELLAPAGCRIRAMWSGDLCGFAEMSLAFCALQELLRRYATAFRAEGGGRETGLRALLASPAHSGIDVDLPVFGLMLTSEFFRRAGWDTWIERDLAGELYRETVRGWFDLVEVLATSEGQLDAIASAIAAIRSNSPNPSVGVIVCGQVFADHPELVGQVGADRMATDPVSSLSQAETLVQARLADQRRVAERVRSAGQVRSLERILTQAKGPPRTRFAAGQPVTARVSAAGVTASAEASMPPVSAGALQREQISQREQIMGLVQAISIPTHPARKPLS